jgi:flagellar export protein FliJ
MRKFVFSLERVLEIRELKKLLAEERLGQSLRDERNAKARLVSSEEKRQDLFVEMRQKMVGSIDPTDLTRLFTYREAVEDEIFRRQGELVRKESLTDSARQEAVLRTQEQKALEKYRDNHWKEYMTRYWWQQGKELDYVGSTRFARSERR